MFLFLEGGEGGELGLRRDEWRRPRPMSATAADLAGAVFWAVSRCPHVGSWLGGGARQGAGLSEAEGGRGGRSRRRHGGDARSRRAGLLGPFDGHLPRPFPARPPAWGEGAALSAAERKQRVSPFLRVCVSLSVFVNEAGGAKEPRPFRVPRKLRPFWAEAGGAPDLGVSSAGRCRGRGGPESPQLLSGIGALPGRPARPPALVSRLPSPSPLPPPSPPPVAACRPRPGARSGCGVPLMAPRARAAEQALMLCLLSLARALLPPLPPAFSPCFVGWWSRWFACRKARGGGGVQARLSFLVGASRSAFGACLGVACPHRFPTRRLESSQSQHFPACSKVREMLVSRARPAPSPPPPNTHWDPWCATPHRI